MSKMDLGIKLILVRLQQVRDRVETLYGDIDELMAARKAEVELADSLGLLFDTDVHTEQKQANIETNTTSETNGGTT